MGLTNYPNGVSSFGMPIIGSGPVLTTGNVFFVDSGASLAADTKDHGSKERPFATIAYATTRCTANNGDVVFIMPGHAESVTDTTEGLDLDIAGVRYVGIGNGASKPTITVGATGITTAFIDLAANSVSLENLRITSGVNGLAVAVYVTGADCSILGCEFVETTADLHMVITIEGFSTAADRCTVAGCSFLEIDAANTNCVRIGQTDGWVVRDNTFRGAWTVAAIRVGAAAAACTNALVLNNYIFNSDATADVCISAAATSTGLIAYNAAAGGHATQGITVGDCGSIENYYEQNTTDLSGTLEPASA